tara:strand:- start:183 stop:407 length:225 start_codon:yes stop_codon:yes gene_type:complete
MDFKELIDHYETLDKSELIEKLVFKNAKLLSQDNEIERLNDEIKRLDDVNEQHRKINGELSEELKKIKEKGNNV